MIDDGSHAFLFMDIYPRGQGGCKIERGMKKLLSLLLVLFVFAGCGGGDDPDLPDKTDPTEKPEDPSGGDSYQVLLPNAFFEYDYFKQRYPVKEMESFTQTSVHGVVGSDTTWICGVKKGKRWMGMFDEHSQELLKEWSGTEILSDKEEQIKIYKVVQTGKAFISLEVMTDRIIFILMDNQQLKEPKFPEKYQLNVHDMKMIDENLLYLSYSKKTDIFRGLFSLDGEELAYDILECPYEEEKSIFLSGFKGDKVWFAKCNEDYSCQEEWTGVEKFNRNIRHHKGYGEYDNGYVLSLRVEKAQILKMDWGYAVAPAYYSTADGFGPYGDVFLLNDGKAFYRTENYYYAGGASPYFMRGWYNASVAVELRDKNHSGNYELLSSDGESIGKLWLSSGSDLFFNHGFFTVDPVSYTEGIYPYDAHRPYQGPGYDFTCFDFAQSKIVWRSELLDDLRPTKSKQHRKSLTCIEKKDRIWTYRYEVVYIDGDKESIDLELDIETGKVVYLE